MSDLHLCIDCGNLDKSRREESPNAVKQWNYGCNSPGRTYTCGWITKDSELKLQGGSCWVPKKQKPVQMDIFSLV